MSTTRPLDARTYLRAVAGEAEGGMAARFQAAIQGTPVFLSLQDRDLRYTWIYNPIASINTASPVGKSDWDIFEPEDAARLDALKRAAMEEGTLARHEVEIGIGGERLHFDLILSPLLGRDGALIGLSTTAVDISTRRRAELERERAMEEAERMGRAKDEFLARLSHELRTPLTPIVALLDALLGDDCDEPLRDHLALIRRNVELEARLIDDLLDHTRVANGKLRLQSEIVDAHALLASVLELCRGDIENKGIALAVDLDAVHPLLSADPARLQQVFWNLVKNAVKFTPRGGSITVRSANDPEGRLLVEVEDNGIGIDAALLPTIFDAFRQGERTTDGNMVGLGLGLAISKSIVDLHGGNLMAMSEGANGGSTFTLTMQTADAPAMRALAESSAAGAALPPEGRTILLVEDHDDTAMVMKLLLERKGYHVNVAPSVACALELAARESFDLLISDIGLPDGSGIDLINSLNKRRPVKGIALSGFGMEDDIKRSIEAGFAEHLIKPVSYQKLRDAIQRLLS